VADSGAPDYPASRVPPGKSGEWVVERVTIAPREYDPASDPRPDCFKFRPGTYTLLRRGPEQFMTDRYDEWWTQLPAIAEALARGGEVLVTGLGLGLIVEAMLLPSESPVRRVTVVERSSDVIHLVAPHLLGAYPDRLEVIHADAFGWSPAAASRFSVTWHDIWPNPYAPECAEEMDRLERRYAPYSDWQGSWPREYLACSRKAATNS
jgi:hypothetical protein